MRKDIEKQFFKAYQSEGVVPDCIAMIRERYDLGIFQGDWKCWYQNILYQEIKEAVEAFDNSIIACLGSSLILDSPLIDEIRDNLSECRTMQEKERYIHSLIVPFKELSELLYPHLATKKRRDEELKVSKKAMDFWKQNSERQEAQGKLEAIERLISCKIEQQKGIESISNLYFEAMNDPKNDVGEVLGFFWGMKCNFAGKLDALCLVNKIDLIKLQRECGVYLIQYRNMEVLGTYIGSTELAQKYINELPKEEPEMETIKGNPIEENKTVLQTSQVIQPVVPIQQSDSVKPQQYKPNTQKVTDVYNFCIDTKVIGNDITEIDFINYVANANFKEIYANAEEHEGKIKVLYIIYVLKGCVDNKDWYRKTAHSVGTESSKCSGANVPYDWKNQANALK
jgi:hypothetical protein